MDIPPVIVTCPVCTVEVPIPLSAHLDWQTESQQVLRVEPDMTDLWAHHFTHDAET